MLYSDWRKVLNYCCCWSFGLLRRHRHTLSLNTHALAGKVRVSKRSCRCSHSQLCFIPVTRVYILFVCVKLWVRLAKLLADCGFALFDSTPPPPFALVTDRRKCNFYSVLSGIFVLYIFTSLSFFHSNLFNLKASKFWGLTWLLSYVWVFEHENVLIYCVKPALFYSMCVCVQLCTENEWLTSLRCHILWFISSFTFSLSVSPFSPFSHPTLTHVYMFRLGMERRIRSLLLFTDALFLSLTMFEWAVYWPTYFRIHVHLLV